MVRKDWYPHTTIGAPDGISIAPQVTRQGSCTWVGIRQGNYHWGDGNPTGFAKRRYTHPDTDPKE